MMQKVGKDKPYLIWEFGGSEHANETGHFPV